VLFAVASLLGSSHRASGAPAKGTIGPTWGGHLRVERSHDDDLFPGGDTRESDSGMRIDIQPELEWRAASHLRVKPWGRLVAERLDTWRTRDLNRWTVGVDAKRGPLRLRFEHGWTNDELYFPTSTGGALVDRRSYGGEVRLQPAPHWLASAGIERQTDDFDPAYDERDDRRWTARLELERSWAARRESVAYLRRDTRSATDLYSYVQHAGRVHVESPVWASVLVVADAQYAWRDYRVALPFASNFGREDDRWRARGAVRRSIFGPVVGEGFWEMRRTDSTRDVKDSAVHAFGFAVTASR
jgi:hypothetical protein